MKHSKIKSNDNAIQKERSFEENLTADYMEDARKFLDVMLADRDECYDLLHSIGSDDEHEHSDTFELDNDCLDSFLKNHGITHNHFFTGVFAYTLSRFTGSSKVLFNIIEDRKSHIDLPQSQDIHAKTLPVLMDCKNQEVASYLEYASQLITSLMKYHLYPFNDLANKYDLNSNITFQYSHDSFYNDDKFGYAVDELEHDMEGDFSFLIFDADDNRFKILILFSDRYSKDFIELFTKTYCLILQEMIGARQLSDINYINRYDEELLNDYNQNDVDIKYGDIIEAFNANLAKYPDNKLVIYKDISYTYGECAFIASEISARLDAEGIEPGDFVPFLVPRNEWYLLLFLGILSAGALYVPLDDAYPDKRLKFILNDIDSKVIIACDETYSRARELSSDLTIINVSDIVKNDVETLSNLEYKYNDLVSIFYTSGSTGIPKGVMSVRKALVNLCQCYVDKYDLNPRDVHGLFTSIGFDVSIFVIAVTIYSGSCLSVIPDEIRFDMNKLNEFFIAQNITHTFITTQVGKLFMQSVEETSLDYLFAIGEKLGEVESPKNYRLIDAYGPTETFNYITAIDNSEKIDFSSIGHVVYNMKAYVLDDELRQVPIGAVGELCMAGYQIAEGYLNREKETQEAFITNPFDNNKDYNRLYRTGDMVRFLPDGSLGIVGRRDSQVKIRGNRIELSEVESVIRQIDCVEDVTAQIIKNDDSNALAVYVVADNDLEQDVLMDIIYDYVGEHKPDYMIPSYVIKLDKIPLNVNGKVDKNALPKVTFDDLREGYVVPKTEIERIIVNAFESVFNQKDIGLNDDFVRLGGDSVKAISIISLLEKNNISCTARDILNCKTPYLIAENIEVADSDSYDAVEGVVDLLPIQKHFFSQINNNEFSQYYILKSSHRIDREILQGAFNELTNVHDILRTRFKYSGNNVIHKILPLNSCICEIEECSTLDLSNTLENIIKKSKMSLNINDQLIKINLVHCGSDCYVVFVIHHLIVDEASWSILIRDLTYILNQIMENEEVNLLRPYPYKSWVSDVKSLVENISDDEKRHWADINALLDDSQIKGKSRRFSFNVDMRFDADNLLMLCEEEYLALSIARAYKKTYGEDIIFNIESNARDLSIANLNETVGWFTSQYPVFVKVTNDKDDISLIRDIYNVKNALGEVNSSGLNYLSLIYTTQELEYKHCPVTINFLSNKFEFKNELFESVNHYYLDKNTDIVLNEFELEYYGIDINIFSTDECYVIRGNYAEGTYLGDGFDSFVDNIKDELEFIGNYKFKNIICCLTESQIGMYLEENIQDKGTAYSLSDIIKCNEDRSIEEIKNAVYSLVDKHPFLKARVLQNGNLPLLICDAYPEIEIVTFDDYSQLIRPFDLNKCLVRFFIMEDAELIVYDMHHIITDAISCTIINRDLELALNGQLDDDVDLGFVYASRDSFESKFKEDYEIAHEFFKKHLEGIDEIPILPEDIEGFKGKISFPIHNVREKIEDLTYNLGITISTFLNAVFGYTYSRFTGGNKVFYNFTEHGRHKDYAQDAFGMFFNVIPVIVDCKNTSVRDYLISVSELLMESIKNSIYPYYLLVNEFNFDNAIVFGYLYDLEDESSVSEEIIIHNDDFNPSSDLFCCVYDLNDGFVVDIEYSDKYSKDTIIRFLNSFKEILFQMLEKEYLSEIDYVDKQDLMLLNDYNQTEHPLKYPDILDAFNDNLKRYPENKLVSYDEYSYTYGECAFVADKIAERLIDLGISPHDYVGFLVERSELYVLCILGIMSAGAAYVPLDDAHPDERIRFILQDTNARVIIASDETYERVRSLAKASVIINVSKILAEDIGCLSSLPVVYSDLACILYTSGTTGVPKGVKITRKSILNLSEFYIREYGLNQADVYALFASIGFDVAMKALFPSIYAGACLTVIPNEIKLDMNAMNKYFIKYGVTHCEISTQVAKLFINQVDNTSLKVLTTGGEKLGDDKIDVNYRFVDSYGPTEACVDVTSIDVANKINPSSIGYLLDNVKAYILDNELRRVPIGAVGELYIAGYQIADGYLNRREETLNAFINNPFDDNSDYNVLYRTGDMVRLLPDGSLGLIGRRDSQVKIRGNRIELSEVESLIRLMDEIEDVSVQTINNDGNNELVAYVVPYRNLNDIGDIICDYIGNVKPDYMIPSFVVCMEEIPLTVNGKVDKNALPAVDLDAMREEYVAATTLGERIIVNAFEKVFNQRIGINDDFIRLGGDSLTAIKLLPFIEGYDIVVADILSLRTPYRIAKNIKEIREFNLDVYSLESGCPLNEPQLNVYLDIIANNKFDSYHIYQFIEISKKYDVDEIRNALDSILQAHPILGMCISDEFDVPYLVKGSKPSITVLNDNDENYVRKYLTEAFDLHDSLCRFIIAEDDSSNYVFACFHHIIFDEMSFNVFERDFNAILDGESIDVDDSFLKISSFSKQIQDTEEFIKANEFYETILADRDESGDLLASISSDGQGIYEYDIELEFDSLKRFLDECGISENVLFTGAFAYTLSRFEGSEKVIFNILENGRDRFDNYDSIGMYVNTLPLLVDCRNQNVSSFMSNVSDLVYGVMKYNYYPFRLLANNYDVNSDIIFQYVPDWIQNQGTYDNEENNLLEVISSDLIAEILNKGDGYLLKIKYSDKYSLEFIRRFTETYELILHDMLDVNSLSDITYTSKSDVEFLDHFNQTEQHLPYEDILDAFNDNLSKNPESELVSYNDITYSYGEGAYIAEKIAKSLVDLGVNPQECVGFLVERSELYPFVIMGVMSMGGVYLPLDDNLPDKRLRFMLTDAGCRVVIGSDETIKRIRDLSDDSVILNVSEIIKKDVGILTELPTVDGDLACILYTSGTTGIPKGVRITRKSLLNASAFYAKEYGLKSSDVYALFSAIGFDVSNFIIAAVLYSGSCLSVIPEAIRLNMDEMNRYFIDHDVTHAFITTHVAKLFMEIVEDTSLDVLFVAGEKLGKVESPEDYILVDGFGPTECFAFISSIKNKEKMHESSVGTLNYNTKAYVLDNELRQVPLGAVGELCLAGYQIADGYLNREDETDRAFVENPFDEGMMYRTGDLVRFLPDGTIGFVGRSDSQVKIRGNRVELSEIEAAIREIDEISDVTVQTIDNELTAYVVTTCEIDDLKKHIGNHLAVTKPDYMIPSYVMKLDFIPLNVNGKVDRSALPQFELESVNDDYAMPSTETERIIVEVFESAFNQKGIGLNDDFIRLGGDSIKAIRVIALLEKNNISCTARDILNYKTPYMIAQNIEETVKKSYGEVVGEVELLPIQSYFFDQINENDYTQSFVLKSKEKLDLPILQKAFDELTNLHDMLRARFKCLDDNVIQKIMPLDTRVCEIKEYSEYSIERFIDESRNALDIKNKLMNIGLIHNDGESYVAIVCHHLIIDGVSWSILIDDLTYIYNRIKNNEKINISRPYPYKSWVDNVKTLADSISDDEKEHWINVSGMLDDSDIEGKTNLFAFRVDADYENDNLLMLSEEEYWALAISRAYKRTYGKDIIFNVESYGRDESLADVSRTIGWFTSQYPVPVNVTNEQDDISLMRDVYSLKTSFRSVDHLGLNYDSLIYSSREMNYRHCPVTFNFLSSEFIFENELFKSVNHNFIESDDLSHEACESTSYGITFNVSRLDDSYIIEGDFAKDTFIGDKFNDFIENIKNELKFIGNYEFDAPLCCLSESQLGVYLDEKVHDKDTAYSVSGFVECGEKSIAKIKDAIHALIDRHPVLRGRVLQSDDLPLLVCDSYPTIEIVEDNNYEDIIKAFDLHENLARFYILDDKKQKYIVYDLHHIISDATNHNIIGKDLSDIFEGNDDGNIDLGFLYASRDSFESGFTPQYKDAKKFFAEEFSDMDDIRFLVNDIEGSAGSVTLPIRGIRSTVESFTHKKSITVSNLLNAIFAFTYSRFTGSDRVFYNFTEHGRHENYTQEALGMFVRTIPVIADCSEKPVDEYLTGMSDLIFESMKNSIYPFRLLAREFNLNNNVFFEYNYDLNDVGDIDNDIIFSDDADRVSEFSCVVNDLKDGYAVSINHSKKYSQDTAERFVKVFKEALIQMLDSENLKDITYVSDTDIEILDSINETEHSLVHDNILEAFNDNLSRYPKNSLVIYDDKHYTYEESAFIANQIAKKLKALGIKEDDNVAFLVERSELYMFSVLGILSSGAAYVPLDDALPDERLNFMINDTEAEVLIVSDDTYERGETIADNVNLLNISEILKADAGTSSKLDADYGNLACILYTSGSTGIPKGVKITRKSLANVSVSYIETYNLNSDDVYGLFSAIGFDVTSFVISAVICAGACLCVIPEDIRLNMAELNRHFIRNNVSHAFIPTQAAKLFMQSVDETSLDVLLVAGEKLGEFESPKNYRLIDAYGPTESFAFVSSIDNDNKIDGSSVGILNYNTRAYILDNELRRVSCGAVGELYLSGYQVAEGYLNRPKENSESFIDNPFDDYGILYATGDMVRLLPDGSLGFLGRRDSQVKIRGNRLELSEVESAIRQIGCVEDVTVQSIRNGESNELVAYVTINKDLKGDELKDIICDYVGEHKPDYMIPSFVIRIDKIPLNVNGKVDRNALPEVTFDDLRKGYVVAKTEIERIIVDAFESVFNQKGIGLNDDFIRLGGDSIKAIRILSLLEKNNISCTARDILNYKTPYLIAENIEAADSVSYDAVEGVVDLLPIQKYFFSQINNNEFSQYFVLKSSSKIDSDILQGALDELTNVHDMLRAKYRIDDNNIIQEIQPPDTCVCTVNEFYLTENLNENIEKIISESVSSLTLDNLMDVSLIHTEDDTYVAFVIHHLIIDGVSWSILLDDLTYVITQMESGNEIDIKRPYPYKKWVEDVKKLAENISKEEKQHWIDVNNIIDDAALEGKTINYAFSVDASYDSDNSLMMSEEEYLAMAISRAYKRTYDEDIIFNRESYGRDESIADVSRTVGWFTSQYPIHINVNGENDLISLTKDAYNIKSAFKDVNNLGLNYGSLVYGTHELEYKHCPVTFNFLSTEFSYKNELFESVNHEFIKTEDTINSDSISHGVTINVMREDDSYAIAGTYANHIESKFEEFCENIKDELDFLGNYKPDTLACVLSEVQMGVYLDEKIHQKGTGYSVVGMIDCGLDKSVEEVMKIINALIERHPILKGRIMDTDDMPIMLCDSYPSIEVVGEYDSNLIRPFDLNECLARFFIIDKEEGIEILYDMHHIISDATSRKLINNELSGGMQDDNPDVGFIKQSNDSFNLKYTDIYRKAHEFFKDNLSLISEVDVLSGDGGGANNYIQLPIHGIRKQTEKLCREYGITAGSLFNAVFAYAYSHFSGNDKVYFNYYEHGRHDNYTQDAVGMFVRTVPLMVNCKDTTVKEYLRNVSDLTLNSMKYSIYPYRLLAKEFNLTNDISFEYNSDLNDVSDIESELRIVNQEFGLFSDFLCVVNDLDDGYMVSVGSCDKYSNEYVIRFLRVFKEVLKAILDKDDLSQIHCSPLSDLKVKTTKISKTSIIDKQHEFVKARTDIEKEVVRAFEKIFDEEIGIYDDFIQLGGDSLDAVKIKFLLTWEVDAGIILKEKTPYSIAQYITKKKNYEEFRILYHTKSGPA